MLNVKFFLLIFHLQKLNVYYEFWKNGNLNQPRETLKLVKSPKIQVKCIISFVNYDFYPIFLDFGHQVF